MGITNFRTYAEKAFPPPLWSVYDRGESNKHIKNVFIDDVFRLCEQRLAINGFYWKPQPLAEKVVQGICVDMSSFCYSVILDTVSANIQHLLYKRSPDECEAESNYQVTATGYELQKTGMSEMMANAFGKQTLSSVFGGVKKARVIDVFERLEFEANAVAECVSAIEEQEGLLNGPGRECPNDALMEEKPVILRAGKKRKKMEYNCDKMEPVGKKSRKTPQNDSFIPKKTIPEADLSETLIHLCAQACCNKLYNVIGSDSIAHSHYFSLHFDENITSCKLFEQHKRKTSKGIAISQKSRSRVFVETLRLVQKQLVVDTEKRLMEEFKRRPQNAERCDTDEKVLRLFTDKNFIQEVVLRKMKLNRVNPTGDIKQQRFKSGEGEWKCIYVTRDIEDEAAEQGENIHHRWLLFGHDWDIALAMLLYITDKGKMYYVDRYSRMLSLSLHRLPKRPEEYKALHFLALCLVGNDYVPRLVNASDKNMTALAIEVNRMLSSEVEHCKTYLETWSNVFADPGNIRSKDVKKQSDRSSFALAIAYIMIRLLKAVYGRNEPGYDSGDTKFVDECFDRSYKSGPTNICLSDNCNRISLRIKDGLGLSLSDCIKSFASCTMWYAAYCMFYMNMSKQFRTNFSRVHDTRDIHLSNPALPMKTCYGYNEPRHAQFELTNVRDLSRVLNNITTYELIGIFVNSVIQILEE